MRIASAALTCCLLLATAAFAAGIDGKWMSERKMERDGQSFTIKQVLDLKSEGSTITGKVNMTFGDREMSADVKDGKLDGSKFKFTTTMSTPNGDFKTVWEGTVEGDSMKGSTVREGGQGGGQARPFEAKRQ